MVWQNRLEEEENMKMKFGFPIWYGNKPLKTAIEKAYRLGFDYIEFDLNSPSLEKITKQEIKLLEKLKEEYNLNIAFHGPLFGIDITHLNDKISEASLDVILDAIKFSEKLKSLYFNFHLLSLSNPHLLVNKNIKNEIYEKAKNNLKKIINRKVVLTIENNGTNPIFRTPKEFRMLKNYKINLCLDIGHAIKSRFYLKKSGLRTLELKHWFSSFKSKILVAHLHDCLIKNNRPIDHLPIGTGIINFDEVFNLIKNTECKYLLIEVVKSLDGLLTETDIKQNLDFCKNNLK